MSYVVTTEALLVKRDFTMYDLSDDLHILIDELKIKKCTLIGHSIGSAIASVYAKQYPQKIDAIIFINSSSKRIPDKDLEKHHTTRRIAISKRHDCFSRME